MQRYFDLNEKQRAALTSDEVKAFEAVELMVEGVVRPEPLPPKPTKPNIGAPSHVYAIKVGYGKLDIAFDTMNEAKEFIDSGALVLRTTYGQETTVQQLGPVAEIELVEAHDHDEIELHNEALSKHRTALKAWEKAKDEWEAAHRAATSTLQPMWDDWHDCQNKLARLDAVYRTYLEYEKMAGCAVVAAKFLRKAYSEVEVSEMFAWFDITIQAEDDAA